MKDLKLFVALVVFVGSGLGQAQNTTGQSTAAGAAFDRLKSLCEN